MKILVAIANHDNGNRQYLEQVISAYKSMPIHVDIVILSNIPKYLGPNIEVRVGVPSSNPWSLPFAHRRLFRERIDEYDFFIYSEDDTLLRWTSLQAFMDSVENLHENEIAGFIRTEKSPGGNIYFSSCHSFFHWVPSSIRERGGKLWAKYSNEHAACFVVSQNQLKRAIASEGFQEHPHEGRYDMLCTAATDIYTQCGFERLVCIDQISDFILPHLPNKYIGKMGLPAQEMQWQIDALKKIHTGELSSKELLFPETSLPGGIGSKRYREHPDKKIEALLGKTPKKVLIWGSGDGIFESAFKKHGHAVNVIPLDMIVGESCLKRGLNILPEEAIYSNETKASFDTIIMVDCLHLICSPNSLLKDLRRLIKLKGSLIVRIPNLNNAHLIKRRLSDPRFNHSWTHEQIGAMPLTDVMLKELLKKNTFTDVKVSDSVPDKRIFLNRLTCGLFSKNLSEHLYAIAYVR